MALSRLFVKNLQLISETQILIPRVTPVSNYQKQKWNSAQLGKRMLCTKATEDKSIAVSDEDDKKSKLKRSSGLWRNNLNLLPCISGLGNALLQPTHNMNKVFENLTPSRLIGRVKEKEDYYKLRYELPGVAKEDVKIRVENGVLSIMGVQKQEEEEESDDEYWSSSSYGYYNTSLVLLNDAKIEEIKADMKDGVLYITIPKDEKEKKNIKEVHVQ